MENTDHEQFLKLKRNKWNEHSNYREYHTQGREAQGIHVQLLQAIHQLPAKLVVLSYGCARCTIEGN